MFKIFLNLLILHLCNSQNNTNPCKNNDDCTILGNDYTCVSVQVSNSDLLYISQCVKEPSCSGKTFGTCPDFTNWPSKYQLLNPECSFSVVGNCNNINTNNTVDCYNSTDNIQIYGIYKCVDANTIEVVFNTTNIPETQVPDTFIPKTENPDTNNTSSDVHFMINIVCLFIIILLF